MIHRGLHVMRSSVFFSLLSFNRYSGAFSPRLLNARSVLSSLPSTALRSSYESQYNTAASNLGSGSDDSTTLSAIDNGSQGEPILGGDFAGLAATFSPVDGSLIEIPTYLIPEALKEWGQEPKCLEILVSEDFANNQELVRTTLTVLPDIGCGIDNLETKKAQDRIELSSSTALGDNLKGAIALQFSTSDDNFRAETIFGLDSDNSQRIRVVLDLIPNDQVFAIQSPMVVTKERRTSSTSTGGTRADQGGLDGRTVTELLGPSLSKKPTFVEEVAKGVSQERNSIQYVFLPGGISLAYGWTPGNQWVLQVAHVQNEVRRVVARKFSVVEGQERLDFDVEYWEEDII